MICPDPSKRPTANQVVEMSKDNVNIDFLNDFLNDVAVFEEQRERQISATYRASRSRRFTPTNGMLSNSNGSSSNSLNNNNNNNGNGDGGRSVYTPTPTHENQSGFFGW